jgi:Ni/Fe-hydrogenase 1 B-type cytochrome subunit
MNKKNIVYKRVFVWSGLLRIFHWAFAISIIILILTGTYIHYPPITTKWAEFKPLHLMATLRYYHFAAGFVFIAAFLIRIYLLFFGNRYERLWDFLPINRRNIKSLFQSLKFYLYLTDKHEWRMGHNVLAGTIYFILFICAAVMAVSGLFLLYPEVAVVSKMGIFFFGSQQSARFVHYFLNWAFLFFIIVHFYIAVWNDFKAPEAIISGAVSGSKFMPAKEVEQ